MEKIKIIALFGKSGAGKDTIQRWITKNFINTYSIVSHTTRPPRDYEVDGKDYHFITDKEFTKLLIKKKILEFSSFNSWKYGTCIDALDPDGINIGVFNPQGIRNLLKLSDTLEVLPVWIQADDKTRLMRSLNREKAPNCKEICRRFLADEEDFSHIDFDYEIYLNSNFSNEYYGFFNRPKVLDFLGGRPPIERTNLIVG